MALGKHGSWGLLGHGIIEWAYSANNTRQRWGLPRFVEQNSANISGDVLRSWAVRFAEYLRAVLGKVVCHVAAAVSVRSVKSLIFLSSPCSVLDEVFAEYP